VRCPPTTRVVFQAAPVFLGRRNAQTSGSAELGDDARCDSLLLRTVSLFYATKTGTDLFCELFASSSSCVAQRFDAFGPAAEEESFVRRGTRAFARIQCNRHRSAMATCHRGRRGPWACRRTRGSCTAAPAPRASPTKLGSIE
jgi:hypothetical protein